MSINRRCRSRWVALGGVLLPAIARADYGPLDLQPLKDQIAVWVVFGVAAGVAAVSIVLTTRLLRANAREFDAGSWRSEPARSSFGFWMGQVAAALLVIGFVGASLGPALPWLCRIPTTGFVAVGILGALGGGAFLVAGPAPRGGARPWRTGWHAALWLALASQSSGTALLVLMLARPGSLHLALVLRIAWSATVPFTTVVVTSSVLFWRRSSHLPLDLGYALNIVAATVGLLCVVSVPLASPRAPLERARFTDATEELDAAIVHDNGEAVARVLAGGRSPDDPLIFGCGAVNVPTSHGMLAVLRAAARDAAAGFKVERGVIDTPLLCAVRGGRLHATEALLAAGADPNLETTSGAPLAWAASHPELIDPLLRAGARPRLRDRRLLANPIVQARFGPGLGQQLAADAVKSDTAARELQSAISFNDLESVKLLLAMGANPDGTAGACPLLSAVRGRKKEAARLLLRKGAHARGALGDEALGEFAWDGDGDLASLLVAAGADVASPAAAAAVARAIEHRRYDFAEALIEAGVPDPLLQGRPCAVHAIAADMMGLESFVAKIAIDPPTHAESPLTMAVERQNFQVVRVLLARGADPRARDGNGHNALALAKGKNPELLTILQAATKQPR